MSQLIFRRRSLPSFVIVLTLLSTALWFGFKPKPMPDNTPPEENRFTKVVLTEKLDEPMEMTFLPDGTVLFVERKGGFKSYSPKSGKTTLIATIPVNTKYKNKQGQIREAEEGLMGIVVHPKYNENHWIYMYYADPGDTKHVLARWEFINGKLIESSKKVLLEIKTQREECCHTGGGMVFDMQGNLYLTVGNNTVNPQSGTSNLDERPGHENSDDQRAPGNTNDLRGKILRIHPEDDGSYSIPEGNLFPKGTEKTRPEIYTMGHRNPWRPSIDSKTGWLYWGEVGPDASNDTERGPRGYDEFNQAKKAGNFGWPYFQGDNKPYNDFDYATNKVGAPFDPAKPVNNSPNNTGLTELPPAEKAFIWYPYGLSEEFPLVGSSGRSATGGPIFHRSDYPTAKRPFPDYYEGKWFIVEFMRGWIMAVTMDENGNYKSMERFLPKENFGSAIDMDFSPEGDLYILEYGTAWFKGNDNARLIRIEYNAGNRKPKVEATASKLSGAIPLKINLSSEGTTDYDGDALSYDWKISGAGITKNLKGANPTLTLDKAGTYNIVLTATDPQGAKASKSFQVKAGNESPVVTLNMLKGNRSFYFPGDTIRYEVKVADKEDGSLQNGKITPAQVAVSIDYMPIGYDQIEISQAHRSADNSAFSSIGKILLNKNDCKSCHIQNKTSIGPSYVQIANRYKNTPANIDKLAKKIITGGSGVWGDHAMSAHPQLSQTDAKAIVEYILNINEKKAAVKSQPLKGSYVTKLPEGSKEKGTYVLRAAYRDRGTAAMSPLVGEEVLILRHPQLNPELAEDSKGVQLTTTLQRALYMVGNNSYLGFKDLDLNDIKSIEINAAAQGSSGPAGGLVEIHLDTPDGPLLGQTGMLEPWNRQRAQGEERKHFAGNVAIPTTSGKHNVYFVFKNEKAADNQIIMQVRSINFKNK